MRSSGLLGVSIQTSAGLPAIAASSACGILEVDEPYLQGSAQVERIEEPVRAAIAVVRHDGDLVRLEQLGHERDGAHARGGHDRARTAFEIRERTPERVTRRIARP